MKTEYHEDVDFAKQTFSFLKKALLRMESSRPFRSPKNFEEGDFEYKDASGGGVGDFRGTEHIFYRGDEVFRQHYIGGVDYP